MIKIEKKEGRIMLSELIEKAAKENYRKILIVNTPEQITFIATKNKLFKQECITEILTRDELNYFASEYMGKDRFPIEGIMQCRICLNDIEISCDLKTVDTGEASVSTLKIKDVFERNASLNQLESILSLLKEEGDKLWLIKGKQFWIVRKRKNFRREDVCIKGLDQDKLVESLHELPKDYKLYKEHRLKKGYFSKAVNNTSHLYSLMITEKGDNNILLIRES